MIPRNDRPLAARDADLLPSRGAALAACREAIDRGPTLLTGAPGVGKTWLAGHLIAGDPARRWVVVDAAPGMSSEDFSRAFAAALGVAIAPGSAGAARLALADALASRGADGDPVALLLDEAHLAGSELLEEVRLLANRLDRADGPSAILVLGQTPLARRLDSRELESLEARLAGRIHLLPLDLDEATALVSWRDPAAATQRDRLERMHRDTGGNPTRLLRLVPRRAGSPPPPPSPRPVETAPAAVGLAAEPLVPARPPLRVEDGLIEVGWDAEAEPEPATVPPSLASDADDEPEPGDEPIDDHYAALQAWEEWARNHGRNATVMVPGESSEDDEIDATSGPASRTPVGDEPGLWADGRQEFGPYSQLFSRLKPVQGAD